jgi:hypothetical protein
MNKPLSAGMILVLGSLLTNCSSGNDPMPMSAPTASLRVVHTSPDAPAVDVTGNGTTLATNAPFKAGTAFAKVPAGVVNLKVNAAGTTTTVISASPTLTANKYYTVLAVNRLSAIEPLVIEDDGLMPATGQVKVRVVHAAPLVPAVDVYVTAPSADLGSLSPTLSAVPFKGFSSALQIPAATYQVRVTAAGSKTAVYDSGSVPLTAGADLVLVAVQQGGLGSPVSLLGLTTDAMKPTLEILDANQGYLRVMHASPNTPAVDVLADGSVVLPSVAYPVNSAYLPVNPKTYALKVNVAGTANTAISASLPVTKAQAQSVYAVNFLSSVEPLVVADDLTPPAAGKAKLRVIHASPDAGSVDVLVNGTIVLPNVPFKAAAAYLTVDAGTYTVKLNAAGTATTALSAPVTLVAGKIYTAIAIGSTAGGVANPLALKLITDN